MARLSQSDVVAAVARRCEGRARSASRRTRRGGRRSRESRARPGAASPAGRSGRTSASRAATSWSSCGRRWRARRSWGTSGRLLSGFSALAQQEFRDQAGLAAGPRAREGGRALGLRTVRTSGVEFWPGAWNQRTNRKLKSGVARRGAVAGEASLPSCRKEDARWFTTTAGHGRLRGARWARRCSTRRPSSSWRGPGGTMATRRRCTGWSTPTCGWRSRWRPATAATGRRCRT